MGWSSKVPGHRRPRTPLLSDRRGLSVVELMVSIVLSSIVVLAAGQLLVTHSRLFTTQSELGGATETLRSASAFLGMELSRLSADGSDLVAMNRTNLWIRSVESTGVVCSAVADGAYRRVGLRHVSGAFADADEDTVSAYRVDSNDWVDLVVHQGWDASDAWGSGGTPVCFWGDSTTSAPRPEAAVLLEGSASDLGQIEPGSVLHRFVHEHYRLREYGSRWWLIRDVRGGSGIDLVAGPFLSPSEDGLVFTYLDEAGNATADPTQVRRIQILMKAKGMGGVSAGGRVDASTVPWDSLTLEVTVHNRRGS